MFIDVELSEAPTGLSGFQILIDIDNTNIAEIVGVQFGPHFLSLNNEPFISFPSHQILTSGVDLGQEINGGATDITFLTLEILPLAQGTTSIELSDSNVLGIHDDNGNPWNGVFESGSLDVN